MKLFYHHVGQVGAEEDFKKTIYKKIPLSFIQNNIRDDEPQKIEIVNLLRDKFPSGDLNCWGVPSGANFVIKNLSNGDAVLLIESTRIDGKIPVLCIVEAFWPIELNSLSYALWGNTKYPYIFFFNTHKVDLMWIDFRDHLGYHERFDPRGKFYSVAEDKLIKYNGPEGYVNFLTTNYLNLDNTIQYISNAYNNDGASQEETERYVTDVSHYVAKLINVTDEPELTDNNVSELSFYKKRPRDAAFSIAIKKIYSNKCAVCNSALLSPDGEFEVQAAHIYPKNMNGSDDVRNGVCLCRIHHWAFDCGWFCISDDYKIIVRADIPSSDTYKIISDYDGKYISLPANMKLAPHFIFLRAARKLLGFE